MKRIAVGLICLLFCWTQLSYAAAGAGVYNYYGDDFNKIGYKYQQSIAPSSFKSAGTAVSTTQSTSKATTTDKDTTSTSKSNTKTATTTTKSNTKTDTTTKKATTTDTSNKQITSIKAIDTSTGQEVTVNLSDISGLTSEWLTALKFEETKHKVEIEKSDDGSIKTVTIKDSSKGVILYQYDPSSHLMAHYHTEGNLKGKINYVTSESKKDYTWRDTNATDPGKGADGYNIVQKFFYDDKGNITKVEYYAFTAGNRKKDDDKRKYSRYMYRQDTYKNGELIDTKYFNDPRPIFWEPTITGTVVKDEQGRYFLKDGKGTYYLLTARKDGFDVDKDCKVGADEMSAIDWEAYVGKEITVRGHEVQESNEEDIYCNGQKAQMFGVVDVIQADKGEKISQEWEKISEKVTEVMDNLFVIVGDEKDISKVYNKIYDKLAEELKKANISDSDILACADQEMKTSLSKQKNDPMAIDFSKYTSSQELMTQAWKVYNEKNYEQSLAFANEVIKRYEKEAKKQQASLTNFAPAGREADYWALNDVGTAYYLLGNIYRDQKDKEKAKINYKKVIDDFSFAQCWDTQGWWWKVKSAAEEELAKLR
ncbi:MAG: tetratricopeptide repeat protein [Candidatus Omnitrophica bacterium]|nr:tetratricopeptide repeat protein [Candidatus Omnitrophota bacterium]